MGWSWFRFFYALVLPVAGCVVLSLHGERVGMGWSLGIAIAIFVYHYLQAALAETERSSPPNLFAVVGMALSIVLVGWSAGFAWRDWIVEQMFVEAGAFSCGVALVAVRKGIGEGKGAPWFLILVVFVLPAAGLAWASGRALLLWEEGAREAWSGVLLLAAFGLSVRDTLARLSPFVLGSQQLAEPLHRRWRIVAAVAWLVALLVGVPLLLS